jgi:hypothetical protein
MTAKRMHADEAQTLIIHGAGNRYDEKVVVAFKRVMNGGVDEPEYQEISAKNLLPGMILCADVISKEGLLLLPTDHVLEQHVIERLMLYDVTGGGKLIVRIRANRRT